VFVSAELRWFWKDVVPPRVEAWFRDGKISPGGGTPRVDEYLLDPGQTELGVKKRGTSPGVEMKGLVTLGRTTASPFEGRVQMWTKWTSRALTIDRLPRIFVEKARWLRKYDTSGPQLVEVTLDSQERPIGEPDRRLARGCQVELVSLSVHGLKASWWSLGFEAFGDFPTIEESLDRTLSYLAPTAPALAGAATLSYPEWLARLQ
jgi:hypothetical protein